MARRLDRTSLPSEACVLYVMQVASTVVVSDLHLHPDPGAKERGPSLRGAGALVRLLGEHPDANLTLAGDIFDFTLLDSRVLAEAGLRRFEAGYPELFRAIAERLRRGCRVTLVPGNHDAALGSPDGAAALSRVFASPNVGVVPWFQRIGSTHIEHGHQFDADNAFVHPLAPHNQATEPLGTALMRRFVGPSDAYVFAHGHTTTLTTGLATAIRHFGPKAPKVVGRYFGTVFSLLRDTLLHKATRDREREKGQSQLHTMAAESGLTEGQLTKLASGCATPRHASLHDTWMRLYCDRVLAILAVGASATVSIGWEEQRTLALGSAAISLAYLGGSWAYRKDRYGLGPGAALEQAARRIRYETDADQVIMGHTHDAFEGPGYINLGSFTFAHGARHFALLDDDGRAELRRAAI